MNTSNILKRNYIALDLETTGLDPRRNEIIEIGIITPSAQGGEPEIYTTLVHPKEPISQEITNITGITNDDVLDSPDLSEVIDAVAHRLRDSCIVGHNISFDTEFLVCHGLERDLSDSLSRGRIRGTKELDTFVLAQVLAPNNLVSLSLSTLTQHYDITHTDAHRAWSDALASFEILSHFEHEILSIPDDLWMWYSYVIARIHEQDSVREFFEDARPLHLASYDHLRESILLRRSSLSPEEFGFRVDLGNEGEESRDGEVVDISEVFSSLRRVFRQGDGLKERSSQSELQDTILSHLVSGESLLVEAPTGIGKTFGYLLPSVAYAKSTHSHVAISTRTKALQDQIFEKDLPKIAQMAQKAGYPFEYCLLKGRSNYLSLIGLLESLDEGSYQLKDAIVLLRALRVAYFEICGDIDSMNWYNADMALISSLNATNPSTLSPNNEYSSLEPISLARSRAMSADVIVINHSLLSSEIEQDLMNRLLPHISTLIVDEAHALESSLTSMMTQRFDLDMIRKLCERFALKRGEYEAKLTPHVYAEIIRQFESMLLEIEMLTSLLLDHPQIAKGLGGSIDAGYGRGKTYEIFVDEALLLDEIFQKKGFLISSLSSHLSALEMVLENTPNRLAKIIFLHFQDALRFLVCYFSADASYARSINKRRDEIILSVAPVRIDRPLAAYLRDIRVCVGVSATLAINDSFDYISNRLGLSGIATARYDEIFDYSRQAVMLLPSDISSIKQVTARDRAYAILGEAIEINGGRTLALFTSYDQVREATLALKTRLKGFDIELHSQGNGSRKKILEAFRSRPAGSALFGTDAFWEGIDISGDGLSLLSIFKLPFLVPTDPVYLSRSREYRDPFLEYALPEMILKLRQGIGRLIRTPEDTGVILLFDDRLISTPWGGRVLDSLPKGLKFYHVPSAKFLDQYRAKKISKQQNEIPQA